MEIKGCNKAQNKSLVHLFKGGGGPGGKAPWPPSQGRNSPAAPEKRLWKLQARRGLSVFAAMGGKQRPVSSRLPVFGVRAFNTLRSS